MAERVVWDHEAGGSSPFTRTIWQMASKLEYRWGTRDCRVLCDSPEFLSKLNPPWKRGKHGSLAQLVRACGC